MIEIKRTVNPKTFNHLESWLVGLSLGLGLIWAQDLSLMAAIVSVVYMVGMLLLTWKKRHNPQSLFWVPLSLMVLLAVDSCHFNLALACPALDRLVFILYFLLPLSALLLVPLCDFIKKNLLLAFIYRLFVLFLLAQCAFAACFKMHGLSTTIVDTKQIGDHQYNLYRHQFLYEKTITVYQSDPVFPGIIKRYHPGSQEFYTAPVPIKKARLKNKT